MAVNPRTPIWRPDMSVALGKHLARLRALDREIPQFNGAIGAPLGYTRRVGTVNGFLTGSDPVLAGTSTVAALTHKNSVHAQIHYQFFGPGAGSGDQYVMSVEPIPTGFGALFTNAVNLGSMIAQAVGAGPPEDGAVTPMWIRICNDAYNSSLPGIYLEAVLEDGTLFGPSNPLAWAQWDVMISGTFTFFDAGF